MEKYREKRKACYLAFLDLKKAYDRLPREVLWRSLREREVSEHLIQIIRDMYSGSRATIRTPQGFTKKVDIAVAVHQGSALSPILFLLTLDSMVSHLIEDPLKTILYAGDIALIAGTKVELQGKVQE
ncbi:unnamed protein product [Nippostrongylus brasiliensis]|uniref:Reverse transcriptase domain-containing protein n=1 Tax=Nippostrongylus brasiliensis TaxID=27835 RepID=A0A0N4YD97_NIPBR|nr:unnamed protein product [Nippostrongylus brasiliensis]